MSSAQPATTVLDEVPLKRALISVYDKTGLEELATGLHAAGVSLVSTGSTAQRIAGEAPTFGPALGWSSLSCIGWPLAANPMPELTGAGAPPISAAAWRTRPSRSDRRPIGPVGLLARSSASLALSAR